MCTLETQLRTEVLLLLSLLSWKLQILVYMIVKITLYLLVFRLILLVSQLIYQHYFLIMSLPLLPQGWVQRLSPLWEKEGTWQLHHL